jgi:hypothetical protein
MKANLGVDMFDIASYQAEDIVAKKQWTISR